MLGRRLFSAAIIISSMVTLLFLDYWLGTEAALGRPGLLLSFLSVVVAVVAIGELAAMFENAAARVNPQTLAISAFAMAFVTCLPALWRDYPSDCALGRLGFAMAGLVAGIVVLFVAEMLAYQGDGGRGEVIDRLARGSFGLVYLSILLAFLMPHRYLDGNNGLGVMAIVTLIATVKMSDAAAYFAGKAYGTIKLAPTLSPGKTVQGSVGGLVGGCVGAALMVWLISPLIFGVPIDKPWWWVVAYGTLVTLAGMFGDLAESLLKRDTSTKDSSGWMPGLGGVLDVIDSLVFAAPVSFLLWI